jgi:hypothetical protein
VVVQQTGVAYTSASYVGPLTAAVVLALLATVIGVVVYRRRVYRAQQELLRQKIRMSDSSRRIDLSQGIKYADSNPLANANASNRDVAGAMGANSLRQTASMRGMSSSSLRDGKAAQSYIGGREAVQQAAYMPQAIAKHKSAQVTRNSSFGSNRNSPLSSPSASRNPLEKAMSKGRF